MVSVGDVVYEIVDDEETCVGCVEQIFFRTWGKSKGQIHSIRTSFKVQLYSRDVPLILYWSPSTLSWNNKLHKIAEYRITHVSERTSSFT